MELPLDFRTFETGPPTASMMQDRLEATRHIYEMAQARLNGEDDQWEKKKEYYLRKIAGMAASYDGSSGAEAAYKLGQISSMCVELEAPRKIVMQWEDAQKRFQRQLAQEEAIGSNRTAI